MSRTFAALRVRNFRLWAGGQLLSLIGTWMQAIAQGWLILELSGSGVVLGLVVAAQFLPVLLLGPYGGLIADRVPKRRLLMVTQSALAVLALGLGLLTITGAVRIWMVFGFALAFGLVNTVDNPGRQSFVPEMVDRPLVRNAVTLNSVMVNSSRALGPAVAGVLVATVGVGVCFLINAASFAAVLVALALMRESELFAGEPVARERGQLRQGLRYVRRTPGLLVPLLMMALVGTLAYEFQVVLPLMAQVTLGGGAEAYGFMTSAMGAGAVVGGLAIATWARTGLGPLTVAAFAFGVAILAAAAMPTLSTELAVLALVGAASTGFLATGNATLQLTSEPRFRGRVMALWSVTFLGSTPIGGPIVGFVAEYFGPRYALGLGGVACLLAGVLGLLFLRRIPHAERRIDESA
ncbi:MFS transporter [Rhizohabitans arisaemae]|uniref:MFS transporter n=1 Tax=Rhizohabitans arisaemae TaxID=2720610 RepID=UPI0024B0B8E5|nr:MFS transporter [Rhizohabitans arisaemae]